MTPTTPTTPTRPNDTYETYNTYDTYEPDTVYYNMDPTVERVSLLIVVF